MVEDLDVHERERALKRVGEDLVGLTGLGDARRVVVRIMCPGSFCVRRCTGF